MVASVRTLARAFTNTKNKHLALGLVCVGLALSGLQTNAMHEGGLRRIRSRAPRLNSGDVTGRFPCPRGMHCERSAIALVAERVLVQRSAGGSWNGAAPSRARSH